MKKVILALAMLGIFGGSALANNNATQAKPAKKQAVTKMTCEEFLLLDESYFPVVVGIAGGAANSGTEIIDVAEVEEITPLIVTECKQSPKASFMDKVKTKWTALKNKM